MQKSVLVPIEKYQRLLENGTTKVSVTKDASTQTESLLGSREEDANEEKAAVGGGEKLEVANQQEDSIKVSEFESLEKPVKKKRRLFRPPGLKDYKSMWIKLNARL
ncbi:MAG: hypothetical protein JAZ03_08285 [Candidatus Thiodiazotropha taylori]|nr:hypothetical protein [Candidatus Thiodiazotropha taylori]MCW4333923.1 hypothetical protein [Candidatus Thiodiazotropha endolucinida]